MMSVPSAAMAGALDIAELPDSAPLLGDPAKLRERWASDGALYFRNVIDHAAVAKVREEYLARLKDVEVVDLAQTEPIWSGVQRLDGKRAKPVSDHVWRDLVADPSFDAVVRTFLGEAPEWIPIVVHRAAPPASLATDADIFAARHQDGVFNYGIDFVTCWVPLMDIGDEIGGLAVAPGSQVSALHPVGAAADIRLGIPSDAIPASGWRRPDYKVGDILMFHSMTAHAGLPNRSDKIRLSIDLRFLPGSIAKPVVGDVACWDGTTIKIKAEDGEVLAFTLDQQAIVRGPKGTPLIGEERAAVIFPGANVIVVPNQQGDARLIRSVSRKYLDLPATWFDPLPAGWVK